MRIKVVRIFNIDGPRMHPNDGRVVSSFIVQLPAPQHAWS
jgi:UDP-glucuronate decarboxylase